MEHRTRGPSEFNLIFQKSTQAQDEVSTVTVSSKGKAFSSVEPRLEGKHLQGTVAIFEPQDRNATPRTSTSVLRSRGTPLGPSPLRPPPSITLTEFEPLANKQPTHRLGPIKSLCLSLDRSNEGCCGYLQESDCLYYVYRDERRRVASPEFITLDQLLRKEHTHKPKLKQRLTLAWILSSSFLQLLESPWLPPSWGKSDIIFYQDPEQPGRYALDQPHLNNSLAPERQTALPSDRDCRMQLSPSVEMLGVVLLELCLGKLLEDQPCRTKWPDLEHGPSKRIFDIVAAKECLQSVEDKAGDEYAAAVGWCLNGILCAAPDKWRADMLQNVVQPFESYHSFLSRDRNM